MHYTPEERLDINRRIYKNEIIRYEAANMASATKLQELTCDCIVLPIIFRQENGLLDLLTHNQASHQRLD